MRKASAQSEAFLILATRQDHPFQVILSCLLWGLLGRLLSGAGFLCTCASLLSCHDHLLSMAPSL